MKMPRKEFVAAVALVAAISTSVVCLLRNPCTGDKPCASSTFAYEEDGLHVEGATFWLPINQGRGFTCPGPTNPALQFWGIDRSWLDDEEKFFDVPLDQARLLGDRWQEGATIESGCKVTLSNDSDSAIGVGFCDRRVRIPWKGDRERRAVWGVCSYEGGAQLLGFVLGVTDSSHESFREVRAGYMAVRASSHPR